MADVYAATDTGTGDELAIKALRPLLGDNAEHYAHRLVREAQAMMSLAHPNVLRVFETGVDPYPYIAMELASESLQDVLRAGRLAPARAVEVTLAALEGLMAVHDAGMVHRDIKPGNLLLTPDGRVVVADFGIALVAEDIALTRTGMAMGSWAFMAPEQRICAHSVGPPADLYAMGGVLFNLLTGESPIDLFAQQPRGHRLGALPRDLAEVVYRATRYAPDRRYESAEEMAAALRAAGLGQVGVPRSRENPLLDLGTTVLLTLESPRKHVPRAPMPARPSARPQLHYREDARLASLMQLAILDTPPEERFDRHTRLAKRVFDVPIVAVSLVDHKRQWFKSIQGLDARETERDIAFCAHAIHTPGHVMVVPNAKEDVRFKANPLVTGDVNIGFYAGCPLLGRDQLPLGTLCIIDTEPRELTERDAELLRDIAAMVEKELQSDLADRTDLLTGLYNLKGFEAAAGQVLHRNERATLILIDCASAGLEAVERLAAHLPKAWPTAAVIARVAENEFAVVIAGDISPDTSALEALLAPHGPSVSVHQARLDRREEPPLQVVSRVVLGRTEERRAPDWQFW